MHKFALLCPGQGAQSAQMFAMANSDPATAEFVHATMELSIAGNKLDYVLLTPELLFENLYAQPLIVAATLANWLALRPHLPQPDLVAGYSVGEFSACAVSGSLDIHAATSLAAARAAMMQACVKEPQGMLAVSGIQIEQIAKVAQQHQLHIAIVTADNKVIVAGLVKHLKLALPQFQQLQGQDIGLTELAVHIASHTPLMQCAGQALSASLEKMDFRENFIPVLAGISGEKINTTTQLRHGLLAQLSNPLRWDACMDAIAENGIGLVLELGPGSALSTMLRARHPHISCRSVSDFRSLEGIVKWVQHQRCM